MKEKGTKKATRQKKKVVMRPADKILNNNSTNGKLAVRESVHEQQIAKTETQKDVICIIGMHRSGTSLVARLLNLCGLDLGPSENFLEPNDSNPLGFFENEDFTYKIDDGLLNHLGGSWDNLPEFKDGWEYDPALEQIVQEAKERIQSFSKSPKWGWKDPRTTVLLPFWESLIPNLRFVICVRNPLEVAKSLAKRDRIPIKKGIHLWQQYMRAAVQDTEGYARIFTFYEDFFKDAESEISRIIEFTGLKKPRNMASLMVAISPGLKHHTSDTLELLNEKKLLAKDMLLYMGLRAFTTDGFVGSNPSGDREALISENISKFVKLLEKFQVQQHDFENLKNLLNEKKTLVTNLSAEQQRLVRDVEAFQSTTEIQQQALNEKEEQVANLSSEQQRLAKKAGTLQSRVEIQQHTLSAKEEQINQLISEQERLSRECDTLQSTIYTQQQMFDKKEQLLTQVTSRQVKATKQLQGFQMALLQKEERVTLLRIQLRSLSQNRRGLQLALQREEEQVDQLQTTLQVQRRELNEKTERIANLTAKQGDLAGELKESKVVYRKREERIKFLVAQLNTLNQKLKGVLAITQEKEDRAHKYQTEVDAAELALGEKDQQLVKREQTIQHLQETKTTLESEVNGLRQNLEIVLTSKSWKFTVPLRKLFDSPRSVPQWLNYMRQRWTLKFGELRKTWYHGREYANIPLTSLSPAAIETGHQESEEAVRWISYMQIHNEDKQALFAHPPSLVCYRLKVPPGAIFQTSVALLSEAWGRNSGGVEFKISISARKSGRSMSKKLWSHPTHFPNHRRWMELRMSLRQFANQEVDLTLSTSVPPGVPEHFALAVWGDPIILTRKQPEHRNEQAGTKHKKPESSIGVNLVGFLNSEKGLGEAVRSEIRDLEAAEIPYILNNVEDPGAENSEKVIAQVSEHNPYNINLIHMNADQIPLFARRHKEYFFDRYNIGYWVWELPSFPQEWYDRFKHFNEIWVPSNFALDAISRVSPIPVIRVPHSINPNPKTAPDWTRSRFGLRPDTFVFLFMFDFCSYMERKNPMALVRAFKKAFCDKDDAVLFIKCSHSSFDPASFAQLQEACRHENIKLLDAVLPREAVNSLLANSDCYTSLHRSEGFGLTMPEAMQLGKPVIATAYSSNVDYMKPSNSFLVKNRLVELESDYGPYKKGCVWAEPDTEHAAELMRYVYDNRSAAAAVAEKGREDVMNQLHPRVIGGQIKERLSMLQSEYCSKGNLTSIKSNMPDNRRISLVKTFYRKKAELRSKAEKTRRLAKQIYNVSSLLTNSNFARLINRVKLFGLVSNYQEFSKMLGSDVNHIFNERIGASQVITRPKDLKKPVPIEETTISVVIPTKNAGDGFRDLLSLLKKQQGFSDIEIIVVDSGSTDNSLKVAEEFDAKIIQISADEFSHSYARNLGAKHASGEYILFTVQDALPSAESWLHELFWVLSNNDVAAVSCTEFPRDDADLFYRAMTWNHFNNFLELGSQDRIMCKPVEENYFTLRKNGQLSTVACLISRDVFMKYRFRGAYAEDLDLGVRLIKDGHQLAFLSSTRIIHSHNRPAYYHLRRGYVDDLWLSRIFPDHPRTEVKPERLLRDIIFMYKIVNSIVCKDLQKVTVPCRVKNLSSIVMAKFQAAESGLYSGTIDKVNNSYIDSNFKSFLENVSNRCSFNGESNLPYDGVLLGAMENFTKIIFEYMYDNSDSIDETMLEDFKSSLFKAFAFMCGVHLASCYFESSKSTREKLKEINDELNDEV